MNRGARVLQGALALIALGTFVADRRLDSRLNELSADDTRYRHAIESITNIRRDARKIYVAALERSLLVASGRAEPADPAGKEASAPLLEHVRTFAECPECSEPERSDRAALVEQIAAWSSASGAAGAGGSETDLMKPRLSEVDRLAENVLQVNSHAASLADGSETGTRTLQNRLQLLGLALLMLFGTTVLVGQIGKAARQRLVAVKSLNDQLEGRVEERTAQLVTANDQLKESLDSLQSTQRQLVEASRMAGKAEVATAVLHNVGNVLNSVTVASGAVANAVRESNIVGVEKLSTMLSGADFSQLLTSHPKGARLTAYVAQLAGTLKDEQQHVLMEVDGIVRNIEHIRVIVGRQQTHAKARGGALESVALKTLCDEAVRMSGIDRAAGVSVAVECATECQADVDRHKVFQILTNLLSNARHAVTDGGGHGSVTVRVREVEGFVRVEVEDSGCGIAAENLARVFNHGFTTKLEGHGFGLHGSACFAMEMGGRLTCRSDGPGKGAAFTLELPKALRRAA